MSFLPRAAANSCNISLNVRECSFAAMIGEVTVPDSFVVTSKNQFAKIRFVNKVEWISAKSNQWQNAGKRKHLVQRADHASGLSSVDKTRSYYDATEMLSL